MMITLISALILLPLLNPLQVNDEDPKVVDVIPLQQLDEIIDVQVDSGRGIVLTRSGLEIVDFEKAASIPVDLKDLVRSGSTYKRIRHDALAIDDSGDPVILWTGRLEDGSFETYVTYPGASVSERLERPLISVDDFALDAEGGLFVLGVVTNDSSQLLHHYSSSGEYLESHCPFDPSDELRSGHLAVSGLTVFLAVNTTPWDVGLFELEHGDIRRQYRFGDAVGTGRIIKAMFTWEGEVYIHSVTGEQVVIDPSESPARTAVRNDKNEIYRLEEGELVLITSTVGPPGTRYGMTPDGNLVAATMSGTSRLREMPALTILVP